MLAFYVVAAERRGIAPERLGGTIQTDILKEYIAQKEWCFPIDPAMRLVGDMIEWCAQQMPRWHPVSICGYHIREAGSTAAQELAFTLKDGLTYVEQAVARGLDVDDFAPRLSFFFNAHIDFFEEIAKYRAARRIWARELRDRFGARSERSLLMRFHTQTAGVSLTAQQPLNNIVRTAIEALAGVLGGTQSLHTNSFDEALALPTEQAVRVALRTQQIIAEETGVANTADPLGGSYFVEALTDRLEARPTTTSPRSTSSAGWSRRSSAASRSARSPTPRSATSRRSSPASGGWWGSTPTPRATTSAMPTLKIDPEFEPRQVARVREYKAARDGAAVGAALGALENAARDPQGEPDAATCSTRARAEATEGEMVRGAAGRVRHLPRSAGLLALVESAPAMSAGTEKKIRVVVAKPGLDGHDRGAKIIARALRDAGMEVIYTGLHQTPEQIVETVIQEDADAVGLSILSGAHMTLVPRVLELLREQDADDVVIMVGGHDPGRRRRGAESARGGGDLHAGRFDDRGDRLHPRRRPRLGGAEPGTRTGGGKCITGPTRFAAPTRGNVSRPQVLTLPGTRPAQRA